MCKVRTRALPTTDGGTRLSDIAQREPQPVDPGRRYVTLLFADLSHSTELAGAMEAEHYAALLAELRRRTRFTSPNMAAWWCGCRATACWRCSATR